MSPKEPTTNAPSPNIDSTQLQRQFIGNVRGQLSTLNGEISGRNTTIEENDAYIYGDYLQRSIRVPAGHDFTPANWLRRVVEIHRTQMVGDGFTVSSSYHGVDVESAFDPNEKPMLEADNNKKKEFAESRNKLFQAIMRDNDGLALFAELAENASAVGTSVLKAYYDEDEGKYCLNMVEAVDNFYAMWNSNSFREADFYGFIYQVSKQRAIEEFGAAQNVATSPAGFPLYAPSQATVAQYVSTQPMVTIMEITGKVQGWRTDANGSLETCAIGQETELNCFIVGNAIKHLIDDPKYMPHYYILPNKRARRRPWGMPDITPYAIALNQTYIETLSDWRTVQSRVNFPKFKAFNFGMDTQLPKPRPRVIEIIGLGEGQDIQPIQNPNSEVGNELDFMRALDELKSAFVRETGVSRNLFDIPDAAVSNSNQAAMTAMKTISDQTSARRNLWTPIIERIFKDALFTLSLWDDSIKELVDDTDDWYIRVEWPPSMRKDDPTFQTMLLNRLIAGTISIQTFMERLGENAKEEIDRLNDEMNNPITAAIHGKMLSMLAEFKIAGPPTSAPPRVNINLRGDITPEQETNLSVQHQFGSGPIFGPTSGPQGELGIRALDNAANSIGTPDAMVSGQGYSAGQPVIKGDTTPAGPAGNAGPNQPQLMTPPTGNTPGSQPVSQPQSGQPATPNSPKGNVKQNNQRKGRS